MEINKCVDFGEAISREIHPKDTMYDGNLESYLKIGMTAYNCANSALQAAGIAKPKSILVLPCGGGRETRWFRAAHPDADLLVSDIDYELTEWTAGTFGGKAVESSLSPSVAHENIRHAYPEGLSMIWVGSLVTHLPEHLTLNWIKILFDTLEDGGVLMLTSAGELVKNIREREDNDLSARVIKSYYESGETYGFAPYKTQRNPNPFPGKYEWMDELYGQSLINKKWFYNILQDIGSKARLVYEVESSYGKRQDVFAFFKAVI